MIHLKNNRRRFLEIYSSASNFVIAFALCVSICSCGRKSDSSKKVSETGTAQAVKTTKAQSRPMERKVTVTGSFHAHEQATLTVKSPGRLQRVAVDVGSVVKKSDLLAQIDRGDYELRVKQAEAALAQARARVGLPLQGDDDQIDLEKTGTVLQAKALFEEATTPEGLSIAALDELSHILEAELSTVPAIKTVLVSVGGGLGGLNTLRAYVELKPHAERIFSIGRFARELFRLRPRAAFQNNISQREVAQEIRKRLKKYPSLAPSIRSTQSFRIGGSGAEIDFSLLGPELEVLNDYAEQLKRRAPELGVIDADTTLKLDSPELRVKINRARAADLGVDTSDIATGLRLMVGGDPRVSRFRDESVNDDYDVQLRLIENDRKDEATIAQLFLPSKNGGLVRLDNLVELIPGQTASRIDRLDRQRQVSLRGAVAPGYGLADRLDALKLEVAKMNLPPGYSSRVVGRGRELETTFQEFIFAFMLSILFMYMILASQYESLRDPLIILLSLPLTVPFAFFTLWITSGTLNLYSALGLLVLFGVVKKNAILQVDHMNNLRRQGMDELTAIIQGNRDRLRPILMTTLTFVAGMLPLAIGSGPGAEERRATALVIIGGQSLALLLTLLVTPVAYSLMSGKKRTGRLKASAVQPELNP